MAVVIPRLESINPAGPQQSERIQVNAPNLLGATAPLREGLSSAVESVSDAYVAQQKELRKKELAAKDLKQTEKAIGYEQALKSRLDVAKQQKGDPTPYYKQFDEEMVKLEESLYDDSMDEEDRALLKEKIIKANGRILDTRSTNYIGQYYGWQKEVADSSVKLRQDNAVKDSTNFNVANPYSYKGVRSALDEIEGTRTAIAIQNGYDIKPIMRESVDPKTGEKTIVQTGWDYSNAPAIEAQIKADIGDTVIPMVKALNAAGKTKEAKFIIDDQKKWLNANDLATLTADNDEANVKNQALALIGSLKNQSGKAALDEVEKSNVSSAIRFKARELIDTKDRQEQNALARKRDQAKSFLYQFIDEKQRSTIPFATVNEFKDSPEYKNFKDVLDATQLKALEERIEAPPTSDPKAKEKISAVYRTTGFANLTDAQFNEYLKGLDKQDRDRYWTLRENIKKPTKGLTEAQSRARANSLNSFLFSDARNSGLIPKTSQDKWGEADAKYFSDTLEPAWIDYQNKYAAELPTDSNGQKAFVRDFIRQFVENPDNTAKIPRKSFLGFSYGGRELRQLPELARRAQVPNSPLRETTPETGVTGPKSMDKKKEIVAPVSGNVDVLNMSPDQYDYWVDQYLKETGNEPNDPDVFQAWINKKVKK